MGKRKEIERVQNTTKRNCKDDDDIFYSFNFISKCGTGLNERIDFFVKELTDLFITKYPSVTNPKKIRIALQKKFKFFCPIQNIEYISNIKFEHFFNKNYPKDEKSIRIYLTSKENQSEALDFEVISSGMIMVNFICNTVQGFQPPLPEHGGGEMLIWLIHCFALAFGASYLKLYDGSKIKEIQYDDKTQKFKQSGTVSMISVSRLLNGMTLYEGFYFRHLNPENNPFLDINDYYQIRDNNKEARALFEDYYDAQRAFSRRLVTKISLFECQKNGKFINLIAWLAQEMEERIDMNASLSKNLKMYARQDLELIHDVFSKFYTEIEQSFGYNLYKNPRKLNPSFNFYKEISRLNLDDLLKFGYLSLKVKH